MGDKNPAPSSGKTLRVTESPTLPPIASTSPGRTSTVSAGPAKRIDGASGAMRPCSAPRRNATWQRCRVHFMRNAMAHVGKGQRTMVAALLRTVFAQDSRAECHQQWRLVADQLREKYPKIATLMDGCEDEVLAHMAFPKAHRQQLHSTNPLERLNAEIKRRTDVVGIFPNEASTYRLVGALLLAQNDEWALQRRYMTLETLAEVGDNSNVSLPAVAA